MHYIKCIHTYLWGRGGSVLRTVSRLAPITHVPASVSPRSSEPDNQRRRRHIIIIIIIIVYSK